MKIYVGIDNGVSGSIGIVADGVEGATCYLLPTPIRSELSYTKSKRNITRIDWRKFRDLLHSILRGKHPDYPSVTRVFLERPMVNPGRFQATASALRSLEATLIVLEALHLSIQYLDSREWQKVMLPSGLKGPPELKRGSMDVGCRMFPNLSGAIRKHGDADGLLMAEWARRERR